MKLFISLKNRNGIRSIDADKFNDNFYWRGKRRSSMDDKFVKVFESFNEAKEHQIALYKTDVRLAESTIQDSKKKILELDWKTKEQLFEEERIERERWLD